MTRLNRSLATAMLACAFLGPAAAANAQDCNRLIQERLIQRYDEYLSTNPNDKEALGNRGLAHLSIGNFDRALEDFDRVARLYPNVPGFVARGLALVGLGRVDLAIAEYNAVLQRDPESAGALYARGLAYRKKGDAARAEADIAAAKRIDPDIDTDFARLCMP